MTLRIPNEGEGKLLEYQLGKSAIETFVLRLYTDNHTHAETDTMASFTELSGNGYAAVNLTAANWTVTPGAPTEAVYPQVTFTSTGAWVNVYGYYVTSATSGKVLWSEAFSDGPYNVTASGQSIKVTPKFTKQDTSE